MDKKLAVAGWGIGGVGREGKVGVAQVLYLVLDNDPLCR